MYFTPFMPYFLVVAILAGRSPMYWAIATGFFSYFQASTPVLFYGGGRLVAAAPAYCLLPIAVMHLVRGAMAEQPRGRPVRSEVWTLLTFTVLTIGGAILMPRVFQGYIKVLGSRGGLDHPFLTPLKPESTNYIQAAYLVMNLMLTIAPVIFHNRGEKVIKGALIGVTAGAVTAIALGFYQLVAYHAGLPWPADVINSNLGVLQSDEQMMYGFKRMSATFLEPSMLSLHFLAALGYGLFGGANFIVGALALVALFLSTSSTAYVGMILLTIIWAALSFKSKSKQVLPILFLLLTGIATFVLIDLYATGGLYFQSLLLNKLESGSATARLNADRLAWMALRESFLLGVGVGSLRASSFVATMSASAGVLGSALFILFLGIVLRKLYVKRDVQAMGIFYALIGITVAWALSVPDWSIPLFWLLAGVGISHTTNATQPQQSPILQRSPA